ncbi:Uncharacterised protein [Legionella sainthelensi]|uniref:hypothetical protein n=1 Tax=Legionella sainthelensi TaxID=28087 RepID=UPI000F6CAD2C|nr:hypothetical protein [Legionella sainthelensi]VEB36025.1 Uncharacterised protein [Legionella sainthelensi]
MGVGTFISVEADRIENLAERMAAVNNTVLKALELGRSCIKLRQFTCNWCRIAASDEPQIGGWLGYLSR